MGFLFLVILSVLHLVTLNVICHFEAHSDNLSRSLAVVVAVVVVVVVHVVVVVVVVV